MLTRTPLDTGWTLTLLTPHESTPEELHGLSVPAEVPGCVHTDLLAAGLLADPYVGLNEQLQHWIGRSAWRYRTAFVLPDVPGARHELRFEGLDTVAEILVNGRSAARTENMHRTYTVDVTDLVAPGANELAVVFSSVYDHTDAAREKTGEFPAAYDEPFNHVRKMAANFGWDWGPTLVTAGIWKPAELLTWTGARLDAVRPLVRVDHADPAHPATVTVVADVRRDPARPPGPLRLTVAAAGAEAVHEIAAGTDRAEVVLPVAGVDLWWPTGLGGQPLYDLRVALTDADGADAGRWQRRIGFRTAELNTVPDADGTPFEFWVNGTLVPVRGVNWIPDDCFVSRVDRDRYARSLDDAVEAGVNLVRVWGGGIYEKDDFYDLCDERGLLVWQDFLFACAAYSEDEPLRGEVLAEARDNVARLAPHPSLVLWNGNNENIWGHADWGWQEALGDRAWGLGYYTGLLPAVVAELDPTRPYWPGSPWSGDPAIHPNDERHGPIHVWDVWNERDYRAYAERHPRFVAEFGFQGPACLPTVERAIDDGPPRPDGPVAEAHQKADGGSRKLRDGMRPHLPAPRRGDPAVELADWIYLAQLNQARAVRFGIEHFRSEWPRCTGTVVWQLNDCWPVSSWSAVDGDGRRKLLWYAVRRAHRPRLAAIARAHGRRPAVHLVNHGTDRWEAVLDVQLHTPDGVERATARHRLDLAPGGRLTLPVDLPATAPGGAAEPLVITVRAGRDILARDLTCEDIAAALPFPRLAADVTDRADGTGVDVAVTAGSLLRDLVLCADRVSADARVDEQMVTLLPGERHVFAVRTAARADDPRWRHPLVLRCVNDLDTPAPSPGHTPAPSDGPGEGS
ncbi:glycoside hydrolase family 2 protein [Streptacidiphilus sp. ASG 303]|uniref:glycoside hydrolase family 2 protein n=1 Tax=Streptacidiphilus sp. ASG 303 TaxID=2896847 RepID=UPI001E4552CC|nr:glycoside hydrolase family 2 protein [Streptacidiphilus sp. ASG 303]MCD0483570.1 glycoside hydrolase family 2 protein [Streptacidiphilus sp. ASG 303]